MAKKDIKHNENKEFNKTSKQDLLKIEEMLDANRQALKVN
jgi:hypothetical protein